VVKSNIGGRIERGVDSDKENVLDLTILREPVYGLDKRAEGRQGASASLE